MENNLTLIVIVVLTVLSCSVLYGVVIREEPFGTAVCGTIVLMIVMGVFALADEGRKNDNE